MMLDRTVELKNLPSGFTGYEITDNLSKRSLQTYQHTSGFNVSFIPRPGFSHKFAAIGVPYGSVHTEFVSSGKRLSLPPGLAHFLEHCVFSRDEQGGLMGSLSELGTSANAYTSYSHTMYYFTAVAGFDAALRLYLRAVFNPYLELDRVEAERPIIIAEIDQYLDDPDMRGMVNLLQNMYVSHPVRNDIGGTAESVGRITSDHLKMIKKVFYHPGTLNLTAVGDIDIKEMLDTLAGELDNLPALAAAPETAVAEEPNRPARREDNLEMDISAPSFLIGIKDPYAADVQSGLEQVIRQRTAHLLLSTILSPSSPLHESLYNQGLINESFNYSYINDHDFGFAICGGESMQPELAAQAVIDGIITSLRHGLDPQLFSIHKRAAAGSFVQALDSVEHSGIVQAQCNFLDINLFDYPAIYDNINCALASDMMSFLSDAGQYSVTVLNPAEVKE